jgi:peptide/nickel transport system substrate-binding protein
LAILTNWPKLAKSWEISPDRKTYTFHLRKGVKFHDGTPFNAETAKFSMEWSAEGSPFGRFIDHIKIVDDYTLQVYLKQCDWGLLNDLGSEWTSKVISPNAVDPAGDVNGKLVKYIGTGPFKLIDYKKDQEAILVRNDDYWGKKPKLEKVIWKTIPDPYTQVLALKAGEVDMIGAAEHHSCLPYTKIAKLGKDPNFKVMLHSYGRYQVNHRGTQHNATSPRKRPDQWRNTLQGEGSPFVRKRGNATNKGTGDRHDLRAAGNLPESRFHRWGTDR